jgi:cytochrome c oxidase subunit 2
VIALWQINVWAEVKFPTRMRERQTQEAFAKEQIQILAVTARQWEWRVRHPDEARMTTWKQYPKRAERFAAEPEEQDVRTVNEVHVWKGADVFVQLGTQDVIHSFFVPNLRVKQDALPGKTIPVWFVATEANAARNPQTERWEDGYDPQTKTWGHPHQVWELACAEFCGSRHSMMRGKLFVHETRDDFLAWLRATRMSNHQREKE